MTLLALIFGMLLQAAPSEGRGVLVARSADTAFLVPLESMRRDGQSGVATLVNLYADAGEPWEEVRRDQRIEVDCRTDRWRVLGETRVSRDGRTAVVPDAVSDYEPVPQDFPPAVALRAMICGGEDDFGRALEGWEGRLPEIRAGLR